MAIHDMVFKKFSSLASREHLCVSDRSNEFLHVVQTRYNHFVGMGDLIIVHLNDLAIGDSNELRVLYGELYVDPFRFCRIYTVMKEADIENDISLSIVSPDFLFTDESYAKRAYPKGTKIALKQPHLLKAPGGFKWLHVDNSRSIVRIVRFPESSPTKFQDWFDNGRRAHDAEEWEECVRNYTKCEIILSQTQPKKVDTNQLKFRFQLHLNRSSAYIELRRYSQALQDAGTCCVISSQLDDSPQMIMQALCLRIESLISLGFYRDAYWFMDDLLRSCSSGTAKSVVPFYWQKCIEYYRIGQAIAGIPKSPKDCKPDADFIGPVVIKKSAKGQGRGLFATKFLKTGTVVLICKALARCHDYKSDQFIHDPMANGLVQNVEDAINQEASVDTVRLFLSFDPSSGSTSIPILPDFALDYAQDPSTSVKKIIRAYIEKLGTESILRILRTVAFDDMSPENTNYWMNPVENRCYHGIWLIPSLINAGDMMSIHATKDINKGEEITIPYFNVLIPYHLRKAACKTWGFNCVCE